MMGRTEGRGLTALIIVVPADADLIEANGTIALFVESYFALAAFIC